MPEPIWQKNLRDAILLDPLTLIHGNIKDLFYMSVGGSQRLPSFLAEQGYVTFDVWLAMMFEEMGFDSVLLYDPVDGAVALRARMKKTFEALAKEPLTRNSSQPSDTSGKPATPAPMGQTAPPLLKSDEIVSLGSVPAGCDDWMVRIDPRQEPVDFFKTLYGSVFPQSKHNVAVICRFSDRYLSYTDRQSSGERTLSLLIQKAMLATPLPSEDRPLGSRLAMIFDLEGGIPQELNICAPFSHSVLIPTPTFEERQQFFRLRHRAFYSEPNNRFDPDSDAEHLQYLANTSDGLKMQDLLSLITLSNHERLGLGREHAKQLLDRFRFGTRTNVWAKTSDESLRNAKQTLRNRVKGQDEVIDDVVPILIRAKLGMSDVVADKFSTRPRGIFFFVGPTGVGKTELSKGIAELIFGDERAMLRFDMSEYGQEHQQARLIGAPPGYVGFDQGGQLTNAITEKPFSVVLFDEIEKAHRKIWDKFLQVLDDGRLTDGRGRTVYFSEAILIFTSNLGTAPRGNQVRGPDGAAAQGMQGPSSTEEVYERLREYPYEQLCDHFRREVRSFFVNEIERPEILNRIGEDNILVFKFLKDDSVTRAIIEDQIRRLDQHLRDKQRVRFRCTEGFKELLSVHPGGFRNNGARGVRNLLSKWAVNRLAEDLFLRKDQCEGKVFVADYERKVEQIRSEPFDRQYLRYEWMES